MSSRESKYLRFRYRRSCLFFFFFLNVLFLWAAISEERRESRDWAINSPNPRKGTRLIVGRWKQGESWTFVEFPHASLARIYREFGGDKALYINSGLRYICTAESHSLDWGWKLWRTSSAQSVGVYIHRYMRHIHRIRRRGILTELKVCPWKI